ncbi:very-long-chain aldehyde decarbonylase CER1-like [Silene latifolia]|uniref:very-long-chain aldehyde decarbonylase CER1-like n=1 Tax=Silene latifolia TaxID=37657 RepID=UPI003D76FAF5
MASTHAFLTHWPWKSLGNFKYVIVAPMVTHSIYSFVTKPEDTDIIYPLIALLMLWRMLHTQIWISFSRYRTARGDNLIVNRSTEFQHVDRETNWDDQILFSWILFYLGYWGLESRRNMALWRSEGVLLMFLLHAGPVEFLYYWLHRALHHHFLYSRYHFYHHSFIVTEPITSVIFSCAEHIAYYVLFAIPVLTVILTGLGSIVALALYLTYIDFMNNMAHCNFEVVPKWVFTLFPPLKYLMLTPSYHSLHHTQFRTNYILFMPIYDYIYGTVDKSTDTLYESSLKKSEDVPQVVRIGYQGGRRRVQRETKE